MRMVVWEVSGRVFVLGNWLLVACLRELACWRYGMSLGYRGWGLRRIGSAVMSVADVLSVDEEENRLDVEAVEVAGDEVGRPV
jgi:hypothetical protein